MGVCCCLKSCISVVNMPVLGLVLGQSLMVISTMQYSPLYSCCLHIIYIVYKRFDWSLHMESLDPTSVQNFISIPFTVFEILLGFKRKKNDKEKWTFCHISHVSGPILR